MTVEIIEKELSYRIVQAAFTVHNDLGPGFMEKIYEEAMAIERRGMKMEVERQREVFVYYRGLKIGRHVIDMIVERKVILELKAVADLAAVHKAQALSYLKATGLQLALVMNFGSARMQIHRVVHTGSPETRSRNLRHSPIRVTKESK